MTILDKRLLKRTLFRLLGLYPPYLGAGIRLTHLADDLLTIEVAMKLTPLNRNYVGTHFGGSLYSMCDPFFMLMLIEALGSGFVVWDKAATIHFKKPGRGTVRARFALSPAEIECIRNDTIRLGRTAPVFKTVILDEEGDVVAELEKTLSVRVKAAARAA